jgi:hypothetical protein
MTHLLATRKGWQNEHLGLFILSRIAFCANPVTVSDDLGSDFFCCLFKVRRYKGQDTVVPQNSFAIQIKSSAGSVDVSNKIDYLRDLEIPYFIGVVDNHRLSLTIYSGEFLPLFFGLRGIPLRLRLKLVNRPVSIERFNEKFGKDKYRVLCPRIAVLNANKSAHELQPIVESLQRLCQRVQRNIATRRSEEHLYSLAARQRFYILAGPGSFKVFRDNVYKRLAEAFFNFLWMIDKKPSAFDSKEAQLYDDFVRALRNNGRALPKYLTRVRHRFRKRLSQPPANLALQPAVSPLTAIARERKGRASRSRG